MEEEYCYRCGWEKGECHCKEEDKLQSKKEINELGLNPLKLNVINRLCPFCGEEKHNQRRNKLSDISSIKVVKQKGISGYVGLPVCLLGKKVKIIPLDNININMIDQVYNNICKLFDPKYLNSNYKKFREIKKILIFMRKSYKK